MRHIMKQLSVLCLLMILILHININSVKCFMNSIEVTLPQGKVKGTFMPRKHHPYITFLGIPYASIHERFQEPGDPPPWNGTFIADRGSIKCTQYSSSLRKTIGQENCLVVNIYTPVTNKVEALPVIVFIPGGSYGHGSNSNKSYDGKFLTRNNVVVVTLNYRLGAFGFLCLRNKVATGNMGLKDQIAALRWVNNNIAQFGGDPDRVTLYGQSVGSIFIAYLLLTNSAKGLFQRVIMSSGALLAPQSYDRDPIQSAATAALRLGYNTSNPEELALIYKNATVDELGRLYDVNITTVLDLYVYKACSEDSSVSEQAVITEPVLSLFKAFRVNPSINIIMGFVNEEGMTWASKYNCTGIDDIKFTISAAVPHNFKFKSQNDKFLFVEEVKSFYFKRTSTHDDVYGQLVDYITDTMIIYPSVLTADAFLASNNTMFNYFFEFDSDRNYNKLLKTKFPMKPGADHGDDLYYVFDACYNNKPLPLSPKDDVVINALTTMWANFAKTGVPSSQCFPWDESKNQLNFLKIGQEIKMMTLPYKERIQFWKMLHNKYSSE